MTELSIFDFMEDGEQYKPKTSTDWKWTFADYPKQKNGIKVFSCFACGGGSTMGYKLAGCEVLGCCEIDKQMNEIYVANHKPKYNFLMDIRDFNKLLDSDIPAELFDIDILDGSPPCTVFSTAGQREEGWGKAKKFREGQKEQTLDDLSFVFIDTVRKLRPKVVIMENVEGLTIGAAWGYVQRIYAEFNASGYAVHHWLLKGETMGIPQMRHRVFFVAIRNDLQIDPKEIDMSFNYAPILFREIKSPVGDEFTTKDGYYLLLDYATENDKDMSDINERITGKISGFNTMLVRDNMIMPTIRASGGGDTIRIEEKTRITRQDIINAQTFPQDYYFGPNETKSKVNYVCGMSVPPVMIKRIVLRLIDEGVFDYKKE
jgi:DNA (cytosine-5)-methyltransferase 1